MPFNSSNFSQILNIAPSGHCRPSKCYQGHQLQSTTSNSSSTQKRTMEISSIFKGVLDAFKLNRFQSNFKQSSFRAYLYHSKCHEGCKPKSGTSKSSSTPARTCKMSLIFISVLEAFKLNRFQPNSKHSFLRACTDHPNCYQGNRNHHQNQK